MNNNGTFNSSEQKRKIIFYEKSSEYCKILAHKWSSASEDSSIVAEYATKSRATIALRDGSAVAYIGDSDPDKMFAKHGIVTFSSSDVRVIYTGMQEGGQDVKLRRIFAKIKELARRIHIRHVQLLAEVQYDQTNKKN